MSPPRRRQRSRDEPADHGAGQGAHRKRKRRRGPPDAPPASRRQQTLDRLARTLLIAAACCLLGLSLIGPLELRWEATSVALLYHGALLGSVLACALGWRSPERDLRWTARLFVAVALVTWAHTWWPPLQELSAWLARVRYLWLEV